MPRNSKMTDTVITNSYLVHDEFNNCFVIDGTDVYFSTEPVNVTILHGDMVVAHFNNYKSFIKIATVIKSFTLQ